MLEPSKKVYLSDSKIPGAGRGIFAVEDIKEGDIIVICPVVLMAEEDCLKLKDTELSNYYFLWDRHEDKTKVAVCLGYGSLYNHSYEPNATYVKDVADSTIVFMALKSICKDEEITVNYHYGNPNDKSPLQIKNIKPYSKIS